jgi:hypothetical protein
MTRPRVIGEQTFRRWPACYASSVAGVSLQPTVHLRRNAKVVASAYLRAAQAYMLISMPTGTSTIFGVFQAILRSPFARNDRLPRVLTIGLRPNPRKQTLCAQRLENRSHHFGGTMASTMALGSAQPD